MNTRSLAGQVLGDPEATEREKTLAGSLLAQQPAKLAMGEVMHSGVTGRGPNALEAATTRLDAWQEEQSSRLPAGSEFKVYDSVGVGAEASVTRYLTVVEKNAAAE
jgi:hypothetical protein